ncbi:MAG: RNB domain-containing ribonuclease [Betaproteobacteria bacterium]|nr:MAG: RNB domain-containing ribonuclease [Betaproteobacteria bacterium]
MNVFYEESGSLRAASVIEDNNTSLQVQTQHGKRAKVKAAAVLLRFEHHSLNEFMEQARVVADEIEPGFLWEACGESEFSFDALAEEYFGHQPKAEEAAGLLMRLQATPTHFYKKGKGRYKPAPPEALKAALASIERKRRQAQLQAEYVQSLLRYELPDAFKPILKQLLYKPDRNLVETKAVEEVCSQLKISVPQLFEKCGALESTREYHQGRFLFEHFPRGADFDDALDAVQPEDSAPADVEAFSIDDVTTTEIDDAFSVNELDNGHWQVGVHISAPALGIEEGSALDAEAHKRMSTVYFPGGKITMLPESVIDRFTLAEGRECPVLSMYVEVDSDLQAVSTRSAIERVRIARNLHHNVLDVEFDEQAAQTGSAEFEFGEQLLFLYRFAGKLERARGQNENRMPRADYSFYVEDDHVRIEPRKRGSPIDKVVSELMILVNSKWAQLLAESKLPGLFRTQASGKVKMSTVAAPHEGLGVNQYIWASSPLRRYADLVNQRQLISVLRGAEPAFAPSDENLFEIMRSFELAYDAYAEFQRTMERYWCLRWLLQEQVTEITAEVIRDDLVRFETLPLVCRAHSLPPLSPGERVEVSVSDVDLIEIMVRCEYKKTLEPSQITA